MANIHLFSVNNNIFLNLSAHHVPTRLISFGLITVTHARGGDNSQFMTYLKRYAYMDCPAIN